MHSARLLLSLPLFTFLTACGSSGGGSGSGAKAAPLSPEQKGKVQSVTSSMDAAKGAASQGRNSGLNALPLHQVAALKPGRDVSEKSRELSSKIEGTCAIDNNAPDKGTTPQNIEFHIKVSGAGCPIQMDSSTKIVTKQSMDSVDYQFATAMSYSVRQPDFAQLNDVVDIQMKGGIQMHGDQKGAQANGKIDGAVVSQAYGKLPFAMTVDGHADNKGSTLLTTLSMSFPDFKAIGKVVTNSDPQGRQTVKYYLNDQEVSKEEFENTFGESANASL